MNQTHQTMQSALEALEGLINRTSAQAIYSFMETERRIAISACVGLRETLAKQPAQQQEPVAWLDPWTRNNVTTDYDAYGKHGIPLYTSPPASKPLTDEQLADFLGDEYHAMTAEEERYFRLAEAAHGIKEQP